MCMVLYSCYTVMKILSAGQNRVDAKETLPNPYALKLLARERADEAKTVNETKSLVKCLDEKWKSRYPLTGYKLTKDSFCRGVACDANAGRKQIQVHHTRPKYQCKSMASCVTVTVKTRHRLHVTARLANSLHAFYPDIRVIVADDEDVTRWEETVEFFRKLNRPDKVRYEIVPPKVGEGRKIAAEKSETPYIMVLDDDEVFVNKTRLEKLFEVLQHTDASIVAGDHDEYNHRYQGVMHFGSDPGAKTNTSTLEIYEGIFHETVPCFPGCYVADVVKNIFMADKEAILNAGSWDRNLTCWEHEEFFCTMRRNNVKVVYCEGIDLVHLIPGNKLRERRIIQKPESLQYIFNKWGLDGYYVCQKERNNPSTSYFSSPMCPPKRRAIPN